MREEHVFPEGEWSHQTYPGSICRCQPTRQTVQRYPEYGSTQPPELFLRITHNSFSEAGQ